jgi:protein-S-isoprenylcysteine O-methyltransferase Ste14
MIGKWLFQTFAWIFFFAVLLFVPAGTLHWPGAWVFLAFMLASGLLFGGWLARSDPGLLAERMRAPIRADQPADDKKLLMVFFAVILIWFVTMGLDERFHPGRMPLALQLFGLVLLIASNVFIMWVFRTNSFAAAVVRVQSERGHHVISTGPYAFVRHPMYSGAIPFMVGVALLLGSSLGTLISPVFAILFGLRARIEERTLTAALPDYADYAARVRYRLLPGVW